MADEKPKRSRQWDFAVVMPAGGPPGPWIDVKLIELKGRAKCNNEQGVEDAARDSEGQTYPLQVKLRYLPNGVLVCTGLRIGEGAGALQGDAVNITSRFLGRLPLGALLNFLKDQDDPEYMESLSLGLPIAPEARTLTPGAKRKDQFYVHQAELFAAKLQEMAKDIPVGSRCAMAYERVAKETQWAPSTVRVHVRRGWSLRPDLKPDGIRTRRVNKPKQAP